MEQLANAIKLAVKLREDSFDHKLAQSKKTHLFDFSKCYKLTLEEACNEAVKRNGFDTRGTIPVYLLLRSNHDEILKWAYGFGES